MTSPSIQDAPRLTTPSLQGTQSRFVSNIQLPPPIPTNITHGHSGGSLLEGLGSISIPANLNAQLALMSDNSSEKYTGSITRSQTKRKAAIQD